MTTSPEALNDNLEEQQADTPLSAQELIQATLKAVENRAGLLRVVLDLHSKLENAKPVPGEAEDFGRSPTVPPRQLSFVDQERWMIARNASATLMGLDERRRKLIERIEASHRPPANPVEESALS
jgi:hypothetical protein